MNVEEGRPLWRPSDELVADANITRYLRWLDEERGLAFDSYDALWRWSITELDAFWSSVWEFFAIRTHEPFTSILSERRMPGARWFEGARLNYAENALAGPDDRPAILFRREDGFAVDLTRAELAERVAAAAAGLRRLGVRPGDRVAAYLPNGLEAAIGFLAAASIGAVWSSCSPDFGPRAVVDRFRQIEPKVLLAVDGYRYGGREQDRLSVVTDVARELPGLEHVVIVPSLRDDPDLRDVPAATRWADVMSEPATASFEPVTFDHPLWVLYSSGTTGLPKAMVHGHGGILLEHLKSLSLHLDLGPDDRFFWFTTTGWMMWNFLLGGLLVGSTIVLYDGAPAHPGVGALRSPPTRTSGRAPGLRRGACSGGSNRRRPPTSPRCGRSARRGRRSRRKASRGCTTRSVGTYGWDRSAAARISAPRSSDPVHCFPCTPARSSAGVSVRRWRRSTPRADP